MRWLGLFIFSIICTLSGCAPSQTYQDTVSPPLESVTIVPQNGTLYWGNTLQLKVIGHYGDGSTQDVTPKTTWTSSDATIAAINASGLASPVTFVGTVDITATVEGITNTTSLTVASP